MVKKVNRTNRYYEGRVNPNFKLIDHDEEEGSTTYQYGKYTVIYDDWDNGYDGRQRQVTVDDSKDSKLYIYMNSKGAFSISYGFLAKDIGDAEKQVANIQEAIKVADIIKKEFNF